MGSAFPPRRHNPHSARSSSDVDVMIGSALKMKRRMSGLSQQELAEKLGVTFQQVQKYENGTNRITASRLNQAAEVFGVSISAFFTDVPVSGGTVGDGRMSLSASSGMPPTGAEMEALVAAFSCLRDPRARRCLIEMAELLLQRDKAVETQQPSTECDAGRA